MQAEGMQKMMTGTAKWREKGRAKRKGEAQKQTK
jgi:hypothetical protein